MLASARGARARKIRFDSRPDTNAAPPATPAAANTPVERGGLSPRIAAYLRTAQLPSPCLVVDVDLVARNYDDLATALPEAQVFYAVKANPADEILSRL
ncbi:MAG: type III PLP-dependent enzyme, partial [Alphaproteobacteria bacterium]